MEKENNVKMKECKRCVYCIQKIELMKGTSKPSEGAEREQPV